MENVVSSNQNYRDLLTNNAMEQMARNKTEYSKQSTLYLPPMISNKTKEIKKSKNQKK